MLFPLSVLLIENKSYSSYTFAVLLVVLMDLLFERFSILVELVAVALVAATLVVKLVFVGISALFGAIRYSWS